MEVNTPPLLIDIGGRRLAMRVCGNEEPTVVLEMGLGGKGSMYDAIAKQVSTFTCVVWYDRAGLGQSDPVPTPRTVQDLVVDLHALLHTANIPHPYILVGHSLGGLAVRFYREHYPDEVVALVLIDSAHEEQRQRQLAILPPKQLDEPSSLTQLRHAWQVSWEDPNANEERIDNLANSKLMLSCRTLGSTPLTVISRGHSDRDPEKYPPELVKSIEQIWRQMQIELAQLSSQSRHLIAAKSGHMINEDEPEVIVEAIRQMVMYVRNERINQ